MSKREFEVYTPKEGVAIATPSDARIYNYEKIYSKKMNTDDTLESVLLLYNLNNSSDMRSKSLALTDVVAINDNGHIQAYSIDSTGFLNLPDFTKDKDIDLTSTSIEIEGYGGTWRAIDKHEIEGNSYYLLENEKWGDDVANILVDSSGQVFADGLREGVSLAVINQIKEMMRPFDAKDPTMNYLKSIEEIDEDGSYSQIDGILNSAPKGAKQTRQSLIAKLHEYSDLVHQDDNKKAEEPVLSK